MRATKQHLQRHKESLRQAKPRLNKAELVRQFSSHSPNEIRRPGTAPGQPELEFSLKGNNLLMTGSRTGDLSATSRSAGETSPTPMTLSETLKASPYGKSIRRDTQRRPLSAGGGFVRGTRGDQTLGRTKKESPEDLPVEIFVRGYTGPEKADVGRTGRGTETSGGVESRGTKGGAEKKESRGGLGNAVNGGGGDGEHHVLSSSWKKVKGGMDLIAVLHTMQHFLGTHRGSLSEEEEARDPPGPAPELGVIQEADEEGTPPSRIKQSDAEETRAGPKASEELPSPGLKVRTKGHVADGGKDRVATLLGESGVPMSPLTPMVGDGARSAIGAKIENLRGMCRKELGEEVGKLGL